MVTRGILVDGDGGVAGAPTKSGESIELQLWCRGNYRSAVSFATVGGVPADLL
jgi:hypothetical protein